MTGASIMGYWALGVVIVFLAVSAGWRVIYAAGDFVYDLSEETQALLGRILYGTLILALLYLMIWGCYLVGHKASAAVAALF
jgi:uncharacterized BrkB/YihY/UPF0761 family membrane protein